MDITNITQLISALRAETAPNSITPDSLGSLLQKIAEGIASAIGKNDLDSAVSQIKDLEKALSNLQKVVEEWPTWRSFAQDRYNPNDSYLATSRTIQDGLPDTNKLGLRIGDVLNGRFVGLSMTEAAMMADYFLDQRRKALRSYAYNGFKDLTQENNGASSDGIVTTTGLQYRTSDVVLNVGGKLMFNLPSGAYSVTINTFCYGNTVLSAPYGQEYKPTSMGLKVAKFVLNGASEIRVSGNSCRIDDIRIEEITGVTYDTYDKTIDVHQGDSLGLIFAFKMASDGYTIHIPEGIYNVGCCDDTDNTGVLGVTSNHVTIIGAGRDKTIITGHYIDNYGTVKCVLCNSGAYSTFKDFSVVAVYLQGTTGQTPAVQDRGIDSAWINCGIIGSENTLFISVGSHYFKNCYIEGAMDIIFGGDEMYYFQDDKINFSHIGMFYRCTLACKGREDADIICAPSGLLYLLECTIDNNHNYEFSQDGKVYLARPWRNGASVVYKQTRFLISSAGYMSLLHSSLGIHGDCEGVDGKGNAVADIHTFNDTQLADNLRDFQYYFENQSRILSFHEQ